MSEEEILRGIGYEKEEETKWAWERYKNKVGERIYFNDKSKGIELKNIYYEDFAISMEELKAMYEICKGRGWIEGEGVEDKIKAQVQEMLIKNFNEWVRE